MQTAQEKAKVAYAKEYFKLRRPTEIKKKAEQSRIESEQKIERECIPAELKKLEEQRQELLQENVKLSDLMQRITDHNAQGEEKYITSTKGLDNALYDNDAKIKEIAKKQKELKVKLYN